jgi:hypothetical protein
MKGILTPVFVVLLGVVARGGPVELAVDFARPEGTWEMTRFALGQGGLQSDAMLAPHVKELKALRPRTIRLFLDEYYRVYPDHGRYDFTRLDRELRAVCDAGARPVLAITVKPPVLYPKVDHAIVHPTDYGEWERLCEAMARHCREQQFRVAGWEVGNEPDLGETGGTPYLFRPADYVTYYERTVAGLLRGDPEARVGGPAVASARSPIVDALIEHCAKQHVPLHFVSWHLYSDSPAAHADNVARVRAKLAKYPELADVKTLVSEWNMDLMRPNLAPGFQPAFVLETTRRFAAAGLDMAAYYHVRDCFVDAADFDWMSPGGRDFMAHWWNVMPQYSALFDHHGRVRPTWYAFRLLGQFEGERVPVEGEQGNIHAIACKRGPRRHLLVWRFEGGGPPGVDVRVTLSGVAGKSFRVVALRPEAAVNNLQVLRFGPTSALQSDPVHLDLEPWAIRWVEIE